MSSALPTAITNLRFAKMRDLAISHKNWVNPRTVTGLDEESLVDLGKDIKARGIQRALIVQKIFATPDKDPNKIVNLVLDGQRRYLGAEEVLDQDAEVPVVDRSVEPIELTPEASDKLMLDVLSSFARTEGLSTYELSEVASRLRDRGKTLAEIGKAIKRDESWVSKILTARKNASDDLMKRWRKGEITEEVFKDLATIKEPAKQAEAATEVVKARSSGDAAEARVRAKELAAQYKNGASSKSTPAPKTAAPDPRAETKLPEKPAIKYAVKPLVLEEIMNMAATRPPTADYVKGVVDAIRFVTGFKDMAEFGKAWHQYVSRVNGTTKPKKASKKKAKAAAKKAKRK